MCAQDLAYRTLCKWSKAHPAIPLIAKGCIHPHHMPRELLTGGLVWAGATGGPCPHLREKEAWQQQ